MISVKTARRTIILSLTGEFDIVTAPGLRLALDYALTGESRVIVMECSRMTFLDLVGGTPLSEARATARRSDTGFFLLHPPARLEAVLDVLGLRDCVVSLEKLPVPARTAIRATTDR
jgi:anti-sigma B factor antagonist